MKGKIRIIVISNTFVALSLILGNICALAQRELGPAFFIFLLISSTLIMYSGTVWTSTQFEISFHTSGAQFPTQKSKCITIGSLILHAIPPLIIFIGAFFSDGYSRNLIISIGLVLQPMHQLFSVPLTYSGISVILKTISQTMAVAGDASDGVTRAEKEAIVQKLRQYRQSLYYQFPVELIITAIPPILYWTLRLPILGWVVYLFINVSFLMAMLSFALVAKTTKKSSSTVPSTNSKLANNYNSDDA